MELSDPSAPTAISLWKQAVHFYGEHSAGVAKTLLPPTVVAYMIAIFLQDQMHALYGRVVTENSALLMHRIGILGFERLMIPMQAVHLLKQWCLWTAYCFALIGICTLVADLKNQTTDNGSVFTPIREHPGRFLKSATLFFGMLVIAFGMMMMIIFGITDVQIQIGLAVPRWESPLVGFIAIALVSAVLVRWIFAVPLTTLQGLRFRRALAESDHMTDNRALALWLLILESEVAGYLTLMVPSWTLVYLNVPPTKFSYYAADAIALVLSAMSQAPLMIAVGLVLTHWTASKTMNESGSDMAQIG